MRISPGGAVCSSLLAREIYTAADDGVLHPILATEVSDGTETGVNSSSTTWRLFNARGSPDAIQFAQFLRMAIAIFTHATASALTPLVSGSPKKMRMASPTYLSIVPPNWRAIFDISVR